jgi:hypothetical protein
MSTATHPPDVGTTLFLLTIRGKFNGKTLEDARQAHNMAAGSPEGVAAARALGDLSHAVYVRADKPATEGAAEALFIDMWNSTAGLGQFFANPQVQEGGKFIWADKDPLLWMSAPGFPHVQLPPPRDRQDRFVGLIRGTPKSADAMRSTVESALVKGVNTGRRLGLLSREYFVVADSSKGSKEVLGMDVWTDLDGMIEFYSKHQDPAVFQLYTTEADTSIWKRPAGHWVEW